MVVVGKPFAEILRIAADLDFSLSMMGIRGRLPRRAEAMVLTIAEELIPAPTSIGGVPSRIHSQVGAAAKNSWPNAATFLSEIVQYWTAIYPKLADHQCRT